MRSITSMERIALAAIASFILAPNVGAYETYSEGCKDSECHGDFRDSPYSSLVDGVSWGNDMHDVHRTDMLAGDCEVCHSSGSRKPVFLDSSVGGKGGYPAISCMGCHGRAEDTTSVSDSGAGLRQHHFNAGETICVDCHDDADPSVYTPVDEGVLPPYYDIASDTDHPNKPTDPFNPSGEEDYAGSTKGLDNDGNLAYDVADPAYVPEPSAAFLQGTALLALLWLAAARRKHSPTHTA